jgi:hypothetical protein
VTAEVKKVNRTLENKKHIMNTTLRVNPLAGALLLMAFLTTGPATNALAQDGRIASRPLSRQEISDYALASDTRISGGLLNVGLGQPLYLEAQVDNSIPAGDIQGVQWAITAKPLGSSMTAPDPSPLTPDIPIFSPGDREIYQLAFPRAMLVPTNEGQYTITATITTTTTNLVLERDIQCSTYMGWTTCQLCHSGGYLPDKVGPWSQTGHSMAFSQALDGISTDHFAEYCITCHSVGFDTNPLAVNDGFDDRAAADNWVFPTNHVPGNWDDMVANYPDVAETANVQCENCHGAGSEHAYSLGDPSKITVSFSAGDCGQCHDAQPYHVKNTEWRNSKHAVATRYPTGENRASCVRCHSGIGFVDYVDGNTPPRTDYEAITCASCHDPHNPDGANPHILRTLADVTLNDASKPGGPTVITEGGMGKICMNCHQGRRDVLTYVKPGAGSSRFGPHHGPQTDMIAGANAWTYGQLIPSSTHLTAIGDSCVTCHLQENTSEDPAAEAMVGGHTFRPRWDGGTPETPDDDVDLVGACVNCHGPITTFDFPKQDFNGDGIIEGVQTEIKHLMDELGRLLPPLGEPEIAIEKSWTEQQLQAGFNYEFIREDGSYGIHNTSYTVGLLKASITDLDPDSDKDGLLDEWEWENLGTLAYNGNDDVDGDGLNNAMEIGAGTRPNLKDSDGDLFDDLAELRAGSNPNDPNDTPGFFVQILPAGELEFPSEAGKTYAIQTISELNLIWSNVMTNMPGTGGPITHLVSTREGGGQAFYRVVEEAPQP